MVHVSNNPRGTTTIGGVSGTPSNQRRESLAARMEQSSITLMPSQLIPNKCERLRNYIM